MLDGDKIWMATGDERCNLLLSQANRHGLITGASGTGKTVTLKVMAEAFSAAGVPVFMADVKGDVTGMAQPGEATENIAKRVVKFGIEDWELRGCPCRFWDMQGGDGVPVRITVSDMGPVLLARLLGLTDAQKGVLNIVFRIADDRNMLLIDLKDLRSMLNYVGEHAKEYTLEYGNIAASSVGAILRALIAVEDQGGGVFFGEPALDLADWFQTAEDGRGYVNILNAAQLITKPQIYSMFLLWMLSELFETLPEVGDPDRPKFVFFFDEAHLLFNDMPKELLDKLVQVVKLIRSKGVGVYFITQSPSDIPDEVLAQLSNKIQHGLRAYTPAEQKSVRAAADSFRQNPAFNAAEAILELGTGEALVSFLDEEGVPTVVQRAKILPPQCLMAAADERYLQIARLEAAELFDRYGEAVDRESAYELLSQERTEAQEKEAARAEEERLAAEQAALEKMRAKEEAEAERARIAEEKARAKEAERLERERIKEMERQQRERDKEIERLAREAERDQQRREREAQKEAERREREAQKQRDQMMKQVTGIFGQIGREASRQITRNLFGTRRR